MKCNVLQYTQGLWQCEEKGCARLGQVWQAGVVYSYHRGRRFPFITRGKIIAAYRSMIVVKPDVGQA